ncbi:MAG: hypothetical protein KF823_07210 [Xanthomonadales bacterium]|nr:hypothetical protein [Xanthomonadales bacterium]
MRVMADDADLTLLLDQAARGDTAAGARFFRATCDELRRMAQRQFRGEHGSHLLQATALPPRPARRQAQR